MRDIDKGTCQIWCLWLLWFLRTRWHKKGQTDGHSYIDSTVDAAQEYIHILNWVYHASFFLLRTIFFIINFIDPFVIF